MKENMMFRQPLQMGQTTLRNRIVMPPMDTAKTTDGVPVMEQVEHYRARARGTGLVIVEHEYILPQGIAHPRQLSMADDRVIPAYRKITEAVHEQGAKVIAQLNHAGVKTRVSGFAHVGPSAVAFEDWTAPEALTKEGIETVIAAFAAAAVRAKEAGFDGVEIHAAHGYLLNQFYSPLMNHREDEYSVATMENRTRIHREAIRAVRDAVGPDLIVAIRFGGWDFVEGGSRIADIPAAVKIFESEGVDLIDMTGGMYGYIISDHTEAGYLKELGFAAKSTASVPVILTGGVKTPQEMETLLQEGAADLIGVGRSLLNDPDWSVKALACEEV